MSQFYAQKQTKATSVNIQTTDDFANLLFAPRKTDCTRISKLIRRLDEDRAERICSCGNYIEVKTPIIDDVPDPKRSKVSKANFCRDRLCPMCAWRLAVRNFANLLKVTEVIKYGGNQLVFGTLTIPNCKGEQLGDLITYLKESLVRLRRKKAFTKAFNGYFLKVEVTYKKETDEYHPHIHLLLSADNDYFTNKDKYLSTEQLVKLWGSCTDDLLFSYNRRTHQDLKGFMAWFEKVDDEKKSLNELAKYSVKSFEVIEESVDTFAYELNGVRLITYYGSFAKVHKKLRLDDEKLTDDMREDLDYILTRFQYDQELGQYKQIFGGVSYEQTNGNFESSITRQYSELEFGDNRELIESKAESSGRTNRAVPPRLCEGTNSQPRANQGTRPHL